MEYSIRKYCSGEVHVIHIHGLLETGYPQFEIPVPQDPKHQPVTSFSFQRFLVPMFCHYMGKGIYLDSDQLVLHDIRDMWNTPFPPGTNVLNSGGWQSAVMLIDCKKALWDIAVLVHQIDKGELTYSKMMNLRGSFASVAGSLGAEWNRMDNIEHPCKLLHYTNMRKQPWLCSTHPYSSKWVSHLMQAIGEGFITKEDVHDEIEAGHVRPSLMALFYSDITYQQMAKMDKGFVFPDDKRKKKK